MKKLMTSILTMVILSLILAQVVTAEEIQPTKLFNGLIMGDSKEAVTQACSENSVIENDLITDIISVGSFPYNVKYSFSDDSLKSVYIYTYDFVDANDCEEKFNSLNMEMMDLYGIPKSMDDTWGFYAWKPMYENQMGTAMYKGFVTRDTVFDIPGMDISIKIGPDEKSEKVCLSATIKASSNVTFDLEKMKTVSGYSITTDSVSGDVFISPDDTKSFTFSDQYTLDYYSTIYPDIYCSLKDGKLYPIFRLWIYYRVTDALWIGDIYINMGNKTWIFKDTNIDYPTKIDGVKKYQTVEKGMIKFGADSIDCLEELLSYQGDVTIRMTSSNSTATRSFTVPQGTVKAIKMLYQAFVEANGTDEDFLSHFTVNKVEKKQLN